MVVEQRLLGDEKHGGHGDPRAEREQLDPAQQHERGDEADGNEHAGRRPPVEGMQQHAFEVVSERGAEVACVPVVGDHGIP